jgi:hypothetical protein
MKKLMSQTITRLEYDADLVLNKMSTQTKQKAHGCGPLFGVIIGVYFNKFGQKILQSFATSSAH